MASFEISFVNTSNIDEDTIKVTLIELLKNSNLLNYATNYESESIRGPRWPKMSSDMRAISSQLPGVVITIKDNLGGCILVETVDEIVFLNGKKIRPSIIEDD